ncbi:hypothetical protein [Nocardioides albus]|uniref:Lipoprotein n=1 Tax=Nocardioides albus TaxID=1841 RepID=A0A7W5FA08_9ACTN|nr:hypothetical protein [Nocardioides albus]MBB3090834.1 hypothetical protein [Nocardioides albus]GGU37787.1 hypothetical protein GCM10007979_41080 [Nocardioides albus]
MRWWVTAMALLLPMVLSGCATGHEDAVRDRAADFQEAVAARDWARACAVLAPETRTELEAAAKAPCAEAMAEETLPTPGALERVDVFGTMAEVRFQSETMFLARFDDGWRLFAAGCTPQQPKPYDCAVHGG